MSTRRDLLPRKSYASSSLLGFATPRHIFSFCSLHNFAFPDKYHIARVVKCGTLKKDLYLLFVFLLLYSLFSSLAHVLAARLFCVFNFCNYLYILYLRPLWSIAGRDFHSSYRLSVYTAARFFDVQHCSFKVSPRIICCIIGVILKKVCPTSVSWNVFLQKF